MAKTEAGNVIVSFYGWIWRDGIRGGSLDRFIRNNYFLDGRENDVVDSVALSSLAMTLYSQDILVP